MMVGRGSPAGASGERRALGLHLMPVVDAVDTPRPSTLVEIDEAGAITAITHLASVEEVAAALPEGPLVVAVDAPLAIPNDRGQRDVDALLAAVDVPVLPASRTRHRQLYGGLRGEELRLALGALPGVTAVETVPDAVLRYLAWSECVGVANDLATFRSTWLGLRPPPYRPKRGGRARPEGLLPATALLARHVELGGWTPRLGDDWDEIAGAATLDAIACSVAARAFADSTGVLITGDGGAAIALPADSPFARRLEVNADRLREAGHGALQVTSGVAA